MKETIKETIKRMPELQLEKQREIIEKEVLKRFFLLSCYRSTHSKKNLLKKIYKGCRIDQLQDARKDIEDFISKLGTARVFYPELFTTVFAHETGHKHGTYCCDNYNMSWDLRSLRKYCFRLLKFLDKEISKKTVEK